MVSPILNVDSLTFAYPDSPDHLILRNISFSLKPGEALGILGPNGGGKSTLLKILVGLLKPYKGKVGFNGMPVEDFRTQIGYVPQTANLNTVFPLRIIDMIHLQPEKKEKIKDVLNLVGLSGKEEKLYSELSGGEKKRALLSLALIKAPKILILDEPTAGLDTSGIDQLLNLLSRLQKEFLTSVVIVDHNINQVLKHCDQILCLNQTSHWHDEKDYLTKNIIESIYHCEFEHLLIHEKDEISEHHFCDGDHKGEKK
ncbi:MAG: metal ABC transporter ATP-binding protein [Bacteriovoracales bacterium]